MSLKRFKDWSIVILLAVGITYVAFYLNNKYFKDYGAVIPKPPREKIHYTYKAQPLINQDYAEILLQSIPQAKQFKKLII